LDGIPLFIIRLLLQLIIFVLAQLFNLIFSFFSCLEDFQCRPNSKSYFPFDKSDYHPISILPVLAKAFDNVMFKQMADYVTHKNLISPFQSGFRPGNSTMTALVRVADEMSLNLELNQPTILVLLDFSKAFDSVCHGFVILKLRQRYGFYTAVAALVSSYLFLRHQGLVVVTIFLQWTHYWLVFFRAFLFHHSVVLEISYVC
jgi:hypothetical protein